MEQNYFDKQKFLKENYEFFKSMIKDSHDAICIVPDSRFKCVNKAFFALFSTSGMHGLHYFDNTDKVRIVTQHYRQMAGLRTKKIHCTIVKQKNETRLFRLAES